MPLPNFLIIGASKAGTTSLWRYCAEHPQIFMSRVKECNFFSRDDPASEAPAGLPRSTVGTLDEYGRLFDDVREETVIGEASPSYLTSLAAPDRIKNLLPDVRLVASLRDPAARAYSAYLMHVRQGRATADTDQAFDAGTGRIEFGKYFDRLKRYYDRFRREQIHICLFDDLSRDPAGTMTGLFRFLGVDATFRPDVETKHNVGSLANAGWIGARLVRPIARRGLGQHLPGWAQRLGRRVLLRPPPECPPDLRDRLRRAYREDILKVQDLIELDLSAWLA